VYGGIFDIPGKKNRLQYLEEHIEGDLAFWDNPKSSSVILQEKKSLESTLQKIQALQLKIEDLFVAIELAADSDGEAFLQESHELLQSLTQDLDKLEIQSLLSGENDRLPALVTINAGAGGTESCDWASMLFRMYLRYVEKQGWSAEIHDIQDGDEAGLRSVTIEVTGEFAFGFLKAESGVHRLIRISPFDSNARRHTSFASVYVSPIIDDRITIQINPSDLRIDTYRASGSGGQHVNRTDSAVRITHLPTGLVVQSQSQRSQLQNKETCMRLMRAKLHEREMDARKAKQKITEDAKSEIAFGSQIRTYTLHPYKLVKDHRTDVESHAPDDVLDGELGIFITSFLNSINITQTS
jgi:peptide chain release factor 2